MISVIAEIYIGYATNVMRVYCLHKIKMQNYKLIIEESI
jgi:hypothetical protein